MRRRLSKEQQRKIIIQFIKKNPNATYKLIRKKTKLHPERVFKSLEEGFKLAGVKPPRTYKIKSKEEKEKILINYIRKNPKAGGHTVMRDTKINFGPLFGTLKNVYAASGVEYPPERKIDKRNRKEKRRQIIEAVKANPLITIAELVSNIETQPYKLFKNIDEIYRKAGVKPIGRAEKRRLKKQKKVIEFIKQNPLATQREINKSCNTQVQTIFDEGIFEAYRKANIKFPFERLKLYGIGIKEIRDRAKSFEEEIAIKLSGYGKVNRLVKTKRGFADIVFERKRKKAIIEIKDYQNKDISISQIKQLNKYLEDCECNLGFLICRKKPRKDKFLIGKNKIYVLEESELCQIPDIMG